MQRCRGAVARISGTGNLRGRALFFPRPYGVLVRVTVRGLPKNESGFYGLHIHEGRTCTGSGYSDTMGHLGSGDRPHPEHTGDLPPLLSCNGRAYLEVLTDRFMVGQVIGRTIVIHSDADDFTSQPAGNAGNKIGCGEICPL